jgi:N-dimethylarginine dimethylaminohydrolase
LAGTYPVERYGGGDGCFYEVLQKYNVTIFRPELIADYNQIFTRDIGFVIDGILKSNILPERERELDAIQYVIDQIDAMKVVRPPESAYRGGDVMLWDDHIFIGTREVITKTISQQEQIGEVNL